VVISSSSKLENQNVSKKKKPVNTTNRLFLESNISIRSALYTGI